MKNSVSASTDDEGLIPKSEDQEAEKYVEKGVLKNIIRNAMIKRDEEN